MKKEYEPVSVELVEINKVDIIRTSLGGSNETGNGSPIYDG